MSRFNGRTVIITGGATGIGLETSEHFAAEGADVVLAGRSVKSGTEALLRLERYRERVHFIATDVSVEEDVKRLIEQTMTLTGRVDVLVNNAAMFYESDFMEESTERWRAVFDTIVNGAYWCTKYAARAMKGTGGGAVVNVSSINGVRALMKSSHYNAAKGALDQLTRGTALELSPLGIRVNGVAPGFIDTALSVIGGVNELETEDFKRYYVGQRKIALARPGLPHEVARAILFLASEEASYIQGAILPVDGGLSITF
ncbi:SDR family NAD(P)-dependent oxidoreductase [Paenibacillus sp. PAMC21692]|uniref:SDR family NAD(P)-dependent oxidoreductase n=1 Tax=Paenibacillus sp. PAMC21692 TaxID=2762320 RepID=UPI00164ECBE5|nr:SDR family oxidoreductase [Paenibacillus sp. PAMC21692]QNK56800.1 SDR family oxidoreductase [Paenibacillus sp. PAMC21692]